MPPALLAGPLTGDRYRCARRGVLVVSVVEIDGGARSLRTPRRRPASGRAPVLAGEGRGIGSVSVAMLAK